MADTEVADFVLGVLQERISELESRAEYYRDQADQYAEIIEFLDDYLWEKKNLYLEDILELYYAEKEQNE